MERRKGAEIPLGWAVNSEGQPTRDASSAIHGSMLPLGGTETQGGHKGFGLAMMVEIFCGISAGKKMVISGVGWDSH